MFRSLFGGKKGRRPSNSESSRGDDSVRSARVGDVVVISGFSQALEDAYVVTEKINRYESSFGKWYDLVGSDGDRPVAIEWSDDGGLTIFVSTQESPMALSAVGLTNDELIRMDQEQSLDNFLEYEGERYSYSNSYEVFRFEDNRDEGEGFLPVGVLQRGPGQDDCGGQVGGDALRGVRLRSAVPRPGERFQEVIP